MELPMHFDLPDLRLFIHIAESTSLTSAAKRAHLSVAAVSGRIKSLEGQLRARLLYRTSRGIELTPAGERLLRHARLICRNVDDLKLEFQDNEKADVGHIRIFANTTAVTELLPRILAKYLSERPAVTVDLQERLTRDIVRGVIEGSTDVGIVAGPVDTPELQALHFSTDKLVLVVPEGHALAGRQSVSLEETACYPMIGTHEGSTLVAFLREQFEQGGKVLPLRIQLYSFESICQMIEAGVGIGVMPDSSAQRYRKNMKVEIIELDEPWVERKRSVLVRDVHTLPACTRALINAIKPGLIEAAEASADASPGP
jgi:DNA-binding transcriptional LysR family regulator